jgi:hypothetical protein
MNEENNGEGPQDDSQEAADNQGSSQPAPEPTSDSAPDSSSGGGFDLNGLFDTAMQVITNPTGFYRGMQKSGGFQQPLVFIVVMAVALALVYTILGFVGLGSMGGMGVGMGGAMAVGIGSLITLPIAALIGSFIGAAILYVIWKLMGSDEDYETAYRCAAFAGAILPITGVAGIVPYLGSIVSVGWGMYLMAIASIEVHGRQQQNAYTVFGILGAILILANINGERQARQMRDQFQGLGDTLGEQFEGLEDMSPEERGQVLGEFLRGLEEGLGDQPEPEE